ncbi:MAG: alpha/beta hydrolase [Deltaproteobacteria bacterium]|nr:alpha/beta hydrolase [Deltaproteobacteria bacterium]
MLLLHGFMDSGATWDLLAAGLAPRGHRLYAPDFRGFGGSDRVSGGGYYHFANYLADLDALIGQLNPAGRLVLVGHSMGGTVATVYAGAKPDRVDRLILMEGLGPPDMDPDVAVVRMRAWLADLRKDRPAQPMASADAALTRLALFHPRVDDEVLASRAQLLSRTQDDGSLTWAFDPLHRSTSPTAFRAAELKAFIAQIRCPTLFIGGGPSGWHPPDEQDRLEAFTVPPRRLELSEAGHMMHWTAPLACARAIAEFIDEPSLGLPPGHPRD